MQAHDDITLHKKGKRDQIITKDKSYELDLLSIPAKFYRFWRIGKRKMPSISAEIEVEST